MKWIEALHIISMVCWFAGLFYLPRIFVYHANCTDNISNERFKIMERRLYYAITMPAGILTIAFGLWLLSLNYTAYSHMMWLHIKLILVALLVVYHIYCAKLVNDFKNDRNVHSQKFYRYFNEFPTLILIAVVILSVVKPPF
jgi:protoporphyrinogen IX oxidase